MRFWKRTAKAQAPATAPAALEPADTADGPEEPRRGYMHGGEELLSTSILLAGADK